MSHFGSLFIFSRALEDRTTLFTECYDGLNLHKACDDSLKRGTDLEVVGNVCHSVNGKRRPPLCPRISCVTESLWPMAKFATKSEYFWIQRLNFLIQYLWRFPTLSARLKMVSEIADTSHHTKKHRKCLKFFRHYLKKDEVFTLIVTPTTLLPLASSLRSQNRIYWTFFLSQRSIMRESAEEAAGLQKTAVNISTRRLVSGIQRGRVDRNLALPLTGTFSK